MNKAAFLDRDGTINVDKEYLYRIEDFEYLNGAVEGLRFLQDAGYLIVIVTNQSGIARGYYGERDYLRLERWLRSDLEKKGIIVSGSYYCPHYPQAKIGKYRKDCKCRKPKTELFWRAQRELEIDMERSVAIGDKLRDLSICKESSVRGILLSGEAQTSENVTVCRSWADIVETIRKADQL